MFSFLLLSFSTYSNLSAYLRSNVNNSNFSFCPVLNLLAYSEFAFFFFPVPLFIALTSFLTRKPLTSLMVPGALLRSVSLSQKHCQRVFATEASPFTRGFPSKLSFSALEFQWHKENNSFCGSVHWRYTTFAMVFITLQLNVSINGEVFDHLIQYQGSSSFKSKNKNVSRKQAYL